MSIDDQKTTTVEDYKEWAVKALTHIKSKENAIRIYKFIVRLWRNEAGGPA